MKHLTFISFLFLQLTIVRAQKFNTWEVYQFSGTDSSKMVVTKVFTNNSKGQTLTESYNGYKNSSIVGMRDLTYFYSYKNDLLKKRSTVYSSGDSTKIRYSYFKKNKLKTEKHFTYKKRLRKDVDKGIGRPGGCIISEDDFEKKRTWELSRIINYSYDKAGNMVESSTLKNHWNSQNRYTWEYDLEGRIIEYQSYNQSKLSWTEVYSYSEKGYSYTRTWFDSKGNAKHLDEKGSGYIPQYTSSFKLDEKGRTIEELVTNEKGNMYNRLVSFYNESGSLLKTINYDKNNEADITHIFKLKK